MTADVIPLLRKELLPQDLPAQIRAEGDKVFIDYTLQASGTGYVSLTVRLELGSCPTGEPCELHRVSFDASAHQQEVEFPEAPPQVVRAERSFWKKATAIHVFCPQGIFRDGERCARHRHDVTRLDAAGFADVAIIDWALTKELVDYKSIFFTEKSPDATLIDYHAAVSDRLCLVSDNEALTKLAADYPAHGRGSAVPRRS